MRFSHGNHFSIHICGDIFGFHLSPFNSPSCNMSIESSFCHSILITIFKLVPLVKYNNDSKLCIQNDGKWKDEKSEELLVPQFHKKNWIRDTESGGVNGGRQRKIRIACLVIHAAAYDILKDLATGKFLFRIHKILNRCHVQQHLVREQYASS